MNSQRREPKTRHSKVAGLNHMAAFSICTSLQLALIPSHRGTTTGLFIFLWYIDGASKVIQYCFVGLGVLSFSFSSQETLGNGTFTCWCASRLL